jgi:hypothetical protein
MRGLINDDSRSSLQDLSPLNINSVYAETVRSSYFKAHESPKSPSLKIFDTKVSTLKNTPEFTLKSSDSLAKVAPNVQHEKTDAAILKLKSMVVSPFQIYKRRDTSVRRLPKVLLPR